MKDITILWLGRDQSTRITSHGKYFYEELDKRVNLVPVWGLSRYNKNNPIRDMKFIKQQLDEAGIKPDVVYIGPPHYNWDDLQIFDIPKLYWWSDPHTGPIPKIEWFNRSKIDVALHCVYGDKENNRWGMWNIAPQLNGKSVLFPHPINTEVFKDYGQEKDIDSLVLGRAARGWYPFRLKIHNWLMEPEQMERWNIKVTKRPKRDYGWTRDRVNGSEGIYAWDFYAKLLNRCKIFPHDGGVMKYPVAKMFETMACKTLALIEPPPPPTMYHLIANYNFIPIDHENFKEEIEYWIENHDGREAKGIIRNAYKMVHEYHSTKVRCDEFMELVENELE